MNTPASKFLPYGRHSIDEDDIAAVADVLRSEFLTTGPVVDEFEVQFARKVDAKYAVACANGTAGLHMAALALRLGEGDAVIVPSLTFIATANAARFIGADVIFADVNVETGLMTPQNLASALSAASRRNQKIKAVFPVHYAGQAVDLAGLRGCLEDAGQPNATIVEDACHAIGTRLDGQPVGSCAASTMAVFSLHPVKTITMGEGGVVTTNDETLRERLLRARNHGMIKEPSELKNRDFGFDADGNRNPWYYEVHELAYNYRASAIQCALGMSQLGKLDKFVAKRRSLAERYDRFLSALAPIVRPLGRVSNCEVAWHLYVVRIDFEAIGMTRAAVMQELASRGIGTQVHYLPLHLQPYYQHQYGSISLPGAESLYRSVLSLPLFPAMHEDDVDRVVTALNDLVRPKRPAAAKQ